MKVKELQKMVNVAWSPAQQAPIMLAAGTAAQQLDASFSTTAALELYSINLADPSYDLELKGSQPSTHRFHKLLWSPLAPAGGGEPAAAAAAGTSPSGLITGGCESGVLQVYNVAQLLAGQNALVAQQEKHQGAVRSLDYNPFQHNLVASGASESEIFIWDLNNTAVPMSPGAKVTPHEDVQGLAWNRQVQHILASVFPSRCVIWDLRKNEPIIKLSDTQSRIRWRVAQWHPEVATQLWLASEEDQSPTVQLWDLRYATAPAKTFQIHHRGVLGLTWCPKDHDLVASCGKDNRIICWNQNTEDPNGEILSELATTNQWNFDVAWCPRNPALLAGSSFDGNVTIYSIHGGVHQQVQTSNKIADSFPGMEHIGHEPSQSVPVQSHGPVANDLKRPPRWMRRPAGACFGFGGKLVTFNGASRTVTINQVITDPELVERSNQLERVLSEGNFADYCRQKADQTNDQHSRFMWYFLKANFEDDPHAEMLNLLGYQADDTANKFKKYVVDGPKGDESNPVDGLTEQMAGLSRNYSTETETSTDDSTDLSMTDNNAVFDAIAAGNQTTDGQNASATSKQNGTGGGEIPYKIRTGQDKEGLICEALLTGNLEAAIELCMQTGKTSEALILAMNSGSDLLAKVQYRYLRDNENYLSNLISALVLCDWTGVVTQCTIDSWKEALVAAITHCKHQLPLLCERLGERLQGEAVSNADLARNAILCYICAGSTERLVEAWQLSKGGQPSSDPATGEDELDKNNNSNRDLQELVEVSMLLQKALEKQGRSAPAVGKLADLLSQYARLLAAQGSLPSALTYLGNSTDPEMEELRERLYYALGHKTYTPAAPTRPQYASQQQQQQPPFNPMFPTIGQAAKMKAYGQSMPPAPMPTLNPVSTMPQQPSWSTSPFQQPPMGMPPAAAPVAPPPLATKPPVGPPPPATGNDLSQPPRPSSVSSQSGGGTLSRAKYVLDPSVTSGPNYGQTNANFYNPMAYQSQQPASNAPAQPPSFYNPAQPAQNNNFKPFTPAPLVQASPYLPGVSPLDVTQQQQQQQQPGMGYPPPPSQAAGPPMGNVQRNPTPPPGWNDPPALKSSSRPQYCEQYEMSAVHAGTRRWRRIIESHTNDHSNRSSPQPKAEPSIMAPITSPLPGGLAPSNGYPDPNSNYMQGNTGQQYMAAPQQPTATMYSPAMGMGGQQQPAAPPQSTINYQNFQPTLAPSTYQQPTVAGTGQTGVGGGVYYPGAQPMDGGAMQQQQQQQPVAAPAAPEPPKQKPPLPEQYVFMQTVFEELKKQCVASAGNPQTKRKLEDVSKRLEMLYDLLRENRLSQNTLNSLNQLVALVQAGDYANGIGLHTQMVSGPDFAQIASFMPGIKVLLQSAMQLQVYLR